MTKDKKSTVIIVKRWKQEKNILNGGKMILFALILAGLGMVIGYLIGFDRGKTALEREILSHVVESPEYNEAVVDTFRKAFNKHFRRQ